MNKSCLHRKKTNVPFVLNLFSFSKEETRVQVLNSYIDTSDDSNIAPKIRHEIGVEMSKTVKPPLNNPALSGNQFNARPFD